MTEREGERKDNKVWEGWSGGGGKQRRSKGWKTTIRGVTGHCIYVVFILHFFNVFMYICVYVCYLYIVENHYLEQRKGNIFGLGILMAFINT